MDNLTSHFYFQDERSDKEYIINLTASGDGYVVNCHYGKRGGTHALATKTKSPVSYDIALKAYEKAVRERIQKGYTLGEGGVQFEGVENASEFKNLLPQLLNPITEDQIEYYIQSDEWILQQKHDGHRRGLAALSDEQFSTNRKGFAVPYPADVAAGLQSLESLQPLIIDGELMGSDYAVFDVRLIRGSDITALPYKERLAYLDEIQSNLTAAGIKNMYVVETAWTTEQKRALYLRMKREGQEGVVAKLLEARYEPGKPASMGSQLKFKFTHDVTCVVISNHKTKSSVGIGLLDAQGEIVNVGNCTIPQKIDLPPVGSLIDVTYLYAYPGGSLYQPVFKGLRDDVSNDECIMSKLHFKAGSTDDDIQDEAA